MPAKDAKLVDFFEREPAYDPEHDVCPHGIGFDEECEWCDFDEECEWCDLEVGC